MERLEGYSAIATLQRALCVKSMQRIPTNGSHMRNSLHEPKRYETFQVKVSSSKREYSTHFQWQLQKAYFRWYSSSHKHDWYSKLEAMTKTTDRRPRQRIDELHLRPSWSQVCLQRKYCHSCSKGIEIILAGRERRPCNHRQKLSEIFV